MSHFAVGETEDKRRGDSPLISGVFPPHFGYSPIDGGSLGCYCEHARLSGASHVEVNKFQILGDKEVNHMFLPREEGQGLVEYALILVLVAIVVIAILALLGPQIANVFSRITSGFGPT